MKGPVKEVPWVLVSILLGTSASLALGIQVFNPESTLDVNLHDTYFVLHTFQGLFFFVFLFMFITFGFRSYRSKKDNFIAFLVLSVSGILLVLSLGGVISIVRLIETSYMQASLGEKGWTLYPPMGTIEEESRPIWDYVVFALRLFQALLIGFLIYTAYRVGLKSRRPL